MNSTVESCAKNSKKTCVAEGEGRRGGLGQRWEGEKRFPVVLPAELRNWMQCASRSTRASAGSSW